MEPPIRNSPIIQTTVKKIIDELQSASDISYTQFSYQTTLISKLGVSTVAPELKRMSAPVVFHSLDAVLGVLNDPKFKNVDHIERLLRVYEAVNTANNELGDKQAKHPFIVFEGLDASGKSTMTQSFGAVAAAELLHTPPKCITHLRQSFDAEEPLLRSAYFCLGNYIASMKAAEALTRNPVVLDRYWHSTTAYALAQAVENNKITQLPPKFDNVYNWPSDLLKPDIVIFLTVSEEERLRRHAGRGTTATNQEQLLKTSYDFRNNVLTAYQNMVDPKLEMVDSNRSIKENLSDIKDRVKHLF